MPPAPSPKSGSWTEEMHQVKDQFAEYARKTQEMPIDGKPRDRFEAEKLSEGSSTSPWPVVALFAGPFLFILVVFLVYIAWLAIF